MDKSVPLDATMRGYFRKAARSRRFAAANRRTVASLKARGIEEYGQTGLVGDLVFNLALCDAADVPYGDVVRVRLGLKWGPFELRSPEWMAEALRIPVSRVRRIYRAAGLAK